MPNEQIAEKNDALIYCYMLELFKLCVAAPKDVISIGQWSRGMGKKNNKIMIIVLRKSK